MKVHHISHVIRRLILSWKSSMKILEFFIHPILLSLIGIMAFQYFRLYTDMAYKFASDAIFLVKMWLYY